MSKSDGSSGEGRSTEQIVVVLQGAQALWSKWFDYRIVDTHVECLQLDTQALQGRKRWLSSVSDRRPVNIRLVLDSCLDEVDRVKIDSLSAGWVGRLQRLRVRRQLADEYPHASIHALPGYATPDVFSLVHHIMPATWERWLLNLQDQHVYITHVATSIELLCHCVRDGLIPSRTVKSPAASGMGEARLICMSAGEERRHLLVDAGKPLYLRMTPVNLDRLTASLHSELRQ
ncbi:MAG: hypothetical protein HKN42_02050, partial [Granulosicoccus sp.]|nr:hypothetical protein [Granulosicoccus sp.]